MSVILDASTALAAVVPDEGLASARAALQQSLEEGLVVPTLWIYEVQNGLAVAMRRNRIDLATATEILGALLALRPEFRAPQGFGQEFRLAQTHALTAYDAAYIAVALATGATLATNDNRLRRSAETLGLALFSG